MSATTVTAAGDETSDPADRLTDRQRDGEVVGATHEVEAARRGEASAREDCAEQPAEEDKPDLEVGQETELAARIVLPAQHNEERFGAHDPAEEHDPNGRPELVLRDAHALSVALEPEYTGHTGGGGEESVGGGHHAA